MLQIPADFCCAELASACLEDGGQYVYFREAGPPVLLLYVGETKTEGSLIPA
jgi:fructoselysine transporter